MARRYRLTARLEESALAELYKGVVDGPGGQEVLVKLHAPRTSDPAFGRALAEINARTMSLGHPGVQGYVEVGMVKDRIAAVRPFVDGFNLGDALRRLASKEVVLPPALALYIVAEAAQAVAAAHAQNWIHGALTPGNILLGKDGRVRVVDFGVLTAMNASEPLRALASKGRHAYRAPEMKSPGSGSTSADVYSLG
ncbi:MAG: protein kinase domain-containing protein, partial [Myxococcales bacterium]